MRDGCSKSASKTGAEGCSTKSQPRRQKMHDASYDFCNRRAREFDFETTRYKRSRKDHLRKCKRIHYKDSRGSK